MFDKFFACVFDCSLMALMIKRQKHQWRSDTFITKLQQSLELCYKSITPPWMFFTAFKLYKWYQITQSVCIVSVELKKKVKKSITAEFLLHIGAKEQTG